MPEESSTTPQRTPGGTRTYVAPDASGTANGTSGSDDIFATGDNQVLIGNGGDDIFHVGTRQGLTIDASGPGISTVSTWGNFTLGDGVDNLIANGDYSHVLTGNALANVIIGGSGDDVIDGGAGHDELHGGGGRDTFIIRADGSPDRIEDMQAGAGGDVVDLVGYGWTSFEEVRAHMTPLPHGGATQINLPNGEALVLFGAEPADFVAANFRFDGAEPGPAPGSSGEPTPTPDEPRAYVAADASGTAQGTAASEDIFATGDNQHLVGGGGNDVFHVSTYQGLTIDASGPGITTVSTWGSFTLGDGVDNLVANGDYAHALAGNTLANVITGAGGNDTIDGGGGNDLLFGGGGDDVFRFTGFSDSHIADWNEGDMIDLRGLVSGDTQERLRVVDDGHGNALVEINTAKPFENPEFEHVVTLDDVSASSINFHDTFIIG